MIDGSKIALDFPDDLKISQLKTKRFSVPYSPPEVFLRIHDRYDYAFLFESTKGAGKLAQYSFIGFEPKLVFKAKNHQVQLQKFDSSEEVSFQSSDPLKVVEDILKQTTLNNPTRFIGGAVGYISYDAIRYWENLPQCSHDDLNYPDIQMGVYDDGIVFDHINGETFYYYRNDDRLKELTELMQEPYDMGSLTFTSPKSNITQDRYEKIVEKTKSYVSAGDIFQAVLSKRFDFNIKGDITKFYLKLREINPSPYLYFIKMGERRVIGSSPEMLVKVEGQVVETYPIAGTRPRVDDPLENKKLANDLLNDPKERAEHVMLVDLARNDVGRVSQYGSVRVPEFMEVYQYSHVQHIVSKVVGKLNSYSNCYDALRAVFPAGTVSGAPKVRAMEIIEESELTRRGPYAGAVGYFSYNGNADFAITIRTLVANGTKCSIQAGGGIVADSVPETEWLETEHKAKALMRALELAEV